MILSVRPIHYAAVNESSAVLRYLLEAGACPFDITKRQGYTPLHLACETGRVENVIVLCDAAAKQSKLFDTANKEGSCAPSVWRKTRGCGGLSSVHLAAQHGHIDVLRALLRCGGVEVCSHKNRSSASSNRVTPLLIAAQHGQLDAVHFLHKEAGCGLHFPDKLKRTALILCAMNGHAHVASYLLREGVDVDATDSSGNTAALYAAAYGWYFVLELLIQAGADLAKSNDWLMTPLSVAYMKGHMGLADVIIQQSNINIDCQDFDGMTLVALTVSSAIDENTIDQLKYLLDTKHANVNVPDAMGSNPLHHLACTTVITPYDKNTKESENREIELRLNVARVLIKSGCNPNKINDDMHTPLSLSIIKHHLDLAIYFVENSDAKLWLSTPVAETPDNNFAQKIALFHALSRQAGKKVARLLFNKLTSKFRQECEYFLKAVDNAGFTPFLVCCNYYGTLNSLEEQQNCREFIVAMINFLPAVILQRAISQAKKANPSEELSSGDCGNDGDLKYHANSADCGKNLTENDKDNFVNSNSD